MTEVVIAKNVLPQNVSGTITLGGTAQAMAAINLSRGGLWVQNVSTGDIWISEIGTAVIGQPSIKIAAGNMYENPMTGCPGSAISIIGATTGQAFSAREWTI